MKDLVLTFGDFTAVASTSFSVRRGEIFGLLPASSGSLQVAGVNLRHLKEVVDQQRKCMNIALGRA